MPPAPADAGLAPPLPSFVGATRKLHQSSGLLKQEQPVVSETLGQAWRVAARYGLACIGASARSIERIEASGDFVVAGGRAIRQPMQAGREEFAGFHIAFGADIVRAAAQ